MRGYVGSDLRSSLGRMIGNSVEVVVEDAVEGECRCHGQGCQVFGLEDENEKRVVHLNNRKRCDEKNKEYV